MKKQIQLSEIFEKDDGVFDYIARKELDYCEPQRKGTPRGEKIGFPAKKYQASLLVALTNFKLKKLADDLNKRYGLSYGLLKKWRTEAEFRKACEDHAEEFANFLNKKIRLWVLEDSRAYAENFEIPNSNWRIFEDAKILSVSVLDHLLFSVLASLRELDQMEGDAYILESVAFFQILQLIQLAKGIRTSLRVSLMADKGVISFVKGLLSSKRILSAKERRIILKCLDNVEEHLGEIISDQQK